MLTGSPEEVGKAISAFFPRSAILAPVLVAVAASAAAAPPFGGTVFLHPAILAESDPSALASLTYQGRGLRTMFDRRGRAGVCDGSWRGGDWIEVRAYLFAATYGYGPPIEVQVNPEYGSAAAAEREATYYAEAIGRLPAALRAGVETVWIQKGDCDWGGGNRNILIHTDRTAKFRSLGAIEEALMHEGAHASLDPVYARSAGWRAAQAADGGFISDYARDYPDTEDLAESIVAFFAAEYRAARIPRAMRSTIRATIPNRIAWFESLDLDMRPATRDDEPDGPADPEPPPDPDPDPEPEPCPDGALCLHGGEFEVSVTWTAGSEAGRGGPSALAGVDGGLFWFFSANNPEMLVKVLDGCGVNGYWWVYVAAATDVGFEVAVEGPGGDRKVYRHEAGDLARALGDIGAFPCSS